MKKTTKIILSITAATGIVAATIYAIIKSGMLEKLRKNINGEIPIITPRQRFRLIAKALDRDIKNVERRTSKYYYDKNKKKYDEINWNEETICRKDIFNN